ncbi:COG1470 family protein [Gilvimarinus sp. F26214L]|uniref:COG1470 family protein n=1 Tax=Gilvimarinus sp. DZF01 TaxID=3461371 RepID=UPI0040466098
MKNKEHWLIKRCLYPSLVVLLFAWASAAGASHFRFGHFTYEARPDISPSTADFNLTVAFRSSAFSHPDIGQTFRPGVFRFGDGRSANFNFEVIARNRQEDWIVGRAVQPGNESGIVRHTYPSPTNNGNPWMASFDGCCRIGSLRNARNANWRVRTFVNLADGNRSPVSNLPPIVTCSKYDCQFLIPAVDRDGDTLRWRMATRAESSISSIPAGMAVDPETGIFTWDGSDSFSNGLYAVQVVIGDWSEEQHKSSVAIDFILNLQEEGANARPAFDTPPTPEAGSRIFAVVGQTLTQVVQATDPDLEDEVFLNHVGLPVGATFEQTVTGGPVGEAILEWTPGAEDMGEHIVTFLANDNRGGAASPVAVTIEVIEPAISNVRIIDTIATGNNTIDLSAFSLPPQSVDVEGDETVVTWHFPTFSVGQLETLSSDLALFNVSAGEQRLVSHQVDVYYNDVNGDEVHQTLPELVVKIAPTLTAVEIVTDKTVYGPNEQAVLSSVVNNLSEVPADALVSITVRDNQQAVVTDYGTLSVADIPAQASTLLDDLTFDTAGVHVGMYEAVAAIVDSSGRVLRQDSAPFSIVTQNGTAVNLGSSVYTDKPVYQSWDQVIIDARAHNLAENSSFAGGQGELVVTDPTGAVIQQSSLPVNSLAPGAIATRQVQLALADSPAGDYQVIWTIRSEGQSLTASQATFQVVRSELQALLGEVEVSHYDVGRPREPRSCEFATLNRSNAATVNADLTYQILKLSDGELVKEILQEDVAVSNSAEHTLQVLLGDDLPEYGGYACVLSARIDGEMQELAAKGFYLHPPSITQHLQLASRGRLLVLVDSPDHDAPHFISRPDEQLAYLNQLLTENGWDYTLVDNAGDFTTEFNSGIYSAIALFSEKVQLSPQTEQLLVEAHNSGVGLLIGGAWNRRNNQVERGIGIELTGRNMAAGSIVLNEDAFENPQYLDGMVNQGLALAHCGAATWARFSEGRSAQSDCATGNGRAAVTAGHYGTGDNAYFAYGILDLATVAQGIHEALLLHALDHIQPDQWSTHFGRSVPVLLTLENESRVASINARFTVSSGGTITGSRYPLQVNEDRNSALWQWDFPAPGSTFNLLYLEMPASVQAVTLDVDIDAGLRRSLMIDHADLQLDVQRPYGEPVENVARALLQDLVADGSGSAKYKFAAKKLDSGIAYMADQRFDKAIKPLLQAAQELEGDEDPRSAEARIAIDELLYQVQRHL